MHQFGLCFHPRPSKSRPFWGLLLPLRPPLLLRRLLPLLIQSGIRLRFRLLPFLPLRWHLPVQFRCGFVVPSRQTVQLGAFLVQLQQQLVLAPVDFSALRPVQPLALRSRLEFLQVSLVRHSGERWKVVLLVRQVCAVRIEHVWLRIARASP